MLERGRRWRVAAAAAVRRWRRSRARHRQRAHRLSSSSEPTRAPWHSTGSSGSCRTGAPCSCSRTASSSTSRGRRSSKRSRPIWDRPSRASIKFQRVLALDPVPSPSLPDDLPGHRRTGCGQDLHRSRRVRARARWRRSARRRSTTSSSRGSPQADPAVASLDAALRLDATRVTTFSPYVEGVDPARTSRHALHPQHRRAHRARARSGPGPTIEIWHVPECRCALSGRQLVVRAESPHLHRQGPGSVQ